MPANEDVLSLFGSYNAAYARKRLQYGSFASRERRYLFVETPKAACSTMKWVLAALEGAHVTRRPIRPESSVAMCIHNRRLHPIKNIFHLPPKLAQDMLLGPDYVRFCVVRNPYARLVSAWSDKIRQVEPSYAGFCKTILSAYGEHGSPEALDAPSFAQFAGFVTKRHDPKSCNHHWQEMKSLLLPDAISYTHVLKTETLANDLDAVLSRIAPGESGAATLAAARTNESLPVAWKQHYDQKLADAVYNFYQNDFEYYQYDRESWRPGADESGAGLTAEKIEKSALMAIRTRNEVINYLYDEIDNLTEELRKLKQ